MQVDLKEYAYQILEIAKQNLRKDGALFPVAFLVTGEQLLATPLNFTGLEEKEQAYAALVAEAREMNALAIITLNDAHYEPLDAPYREPVRPGQLAEEGAPECILLTVSGPGMENWEIILPYQRTAEGIAFAEPQEITGGQIALLGEWGAGSPERPS